MRRTLAVVFVLCVLVSTACPADFSAKEAKNHVGETATVCGAVVSTRYLPDSKHQPTFLNFDEFFPNQVFTVVIWGEDRAKFNKPEETYRGRKVCATGKIELFKGVPEIIVTSPDQLKAQ